MRKVCYVNSKITTTNNSLENNIDIHTHLPRRVRQLVVSVSCGANNRLNFYLCPITFSSTYDTLLRIIEFLF